MLIIEDIKTELDKLINDYIVKNKYVSYEIIKSSPLIKSELIRLVFFGVFNISINYTNKIKFYRFN